MRLWALATLGAILLLASCGRPDPSGIYLSASDRQVTLVQIVETKDGNLTGRLEQLTVAPDGPVKDQTVPLDGATSGHDLVFKPTSVWLGGLQATGTFSGDLITLTGTGFTLNAARSDLYKYHLSVAHLQSVAAEDRKIIAPAKATQAARAAQIRAIQDAADKTVAIENMPVQLRGYASRMEAGITNAPNFAQRAASNTARVDKILRYAATLSGVNRSQMVVEANQVEVGTNQIEVARSQYALELNQLLEGGASIVGQLQQFCDSPLGVQFAHPCEGARAAIAEFKTTVGRGRAAFSPYKQALQDELAKQAAMIQRAGG